jgi:hypothetical protein
MEPDVQRDACPAAGTSGQDSKAAEHMAVDGFRLRGILRFLEKLLYTWHAAPFLGLLYAVAHKDMEAPFFIKGRILLYSRGPAFPDLLQRPGGCPEEMQHGTVTARMERKVTDYGCGPKLIGTEHKPYGYGHEPTESSFAGKTGFKMA